MKATKANDLLNKYRNAKLVITSRLHCALPCRAFNTDVIFIHKNLNTDHRFSGLLEILNGNIDKIDYNTKKINRNIINKFKSNIIKIFKNKIINYSPL